MPTKDQMIQFKYGLQTNYDKIGTKDLNTVYFTTDSQRLFVGDTEYTRPIQHGTALPTGFVPPNSFFYHETEKALYFSKDGEAWVACSNFYTHPTFTARTLGPDTGKTLTFGDTFTVPNVTVNTEGHVSAGNTVTFTLPAAPAQVKDTLSTTGTGNAVTAVELADDGHTFTVTKGETFATKASVDTIAAKPAMDITAEQITDWDGEIGAKAAAEAAQSTANAAVVANDAITKGTHTKITYDEKGLVTGGADLVAADIPDLDAAKITTGTFAAARIPNLSADKITSGTLNVARIPNITLSKVTDAGTAAAKDAATDAIVAESTDTGLVSAAQVATFVKGQVADLSGAMHFKGIKETLPANTTGYSAGDVIIVGNKEYVCGDDAKWHELGDETIYAVKGSIVNADIASNAAIDQSKIAGLTTDLAAKATPKDIEDKIAEHVTDNHKTLTIGTKTYDGSEAVTVAKADLGLGNVDNTADANKSVKSAATLTTARKINGVEFDGSKDITVHDSVSGLTDTTISATVANESVLVYNDTTKKWENKPQAPKASVADQAIKASQDANGKVIDQTYATKEEVTASTLVWGTF